LERNKKVVIETNDRLSLLFIIPSLGGGGAERVITTLLRHLNPKIFSLVIAVVDLKGSVYKDDIPDTVEVIDLKCHRVRYALPKIIALIIRRKPDIVFTTLGHLNIALALIRPFLPNKTTYIARETIIASYGILKYGNPKLWNILYRKMYSKFDCIVCQSIGMQTDLIENFGISKNKTKVINNPVDVERVKKLASKCFEQQYSFDHKCTFVSVGRLVPQKGFDILIKAIALVNSPKIEVFLLGEGPLREELELLALSEGVSKQINFVGFQENPYQWIAKADAFILSSRFEGFPNVVLEALACGTPIISTPEPGGVKEILTDIDRCIIADAIDAESLSRAILLWLDGQRNKISFEYVEKYSIKNILSQYEALLLNNGSLTNS
tara:strand:- start:1954 stop:3096 length:1143 start_codon:yes stop_codon:yes gene_type:complete